MKCKEQMVQDMKDSLAGLSKEAQESTVSDASMSAMGLTMISVFIDIRDILEHLLIELQGRP